ncbi:sugar phosphate isomerase/epimerase family protein [Portibacter lacus]|uniref:Sugar phosphate isomerase/epimerase n=1 Tax=Portibacter lacus TaxID=1099794 RepID=A0AA37SL27_9BACT|nr:sugar phosphate isomerase/epimerase [Portibacter lacus]GLR15872.1 hypothetical protein GCM10007940_04870 [Portibacter lacus]
MSNRRNFIKKSAIVTGGIPFLGSLDLLPSFKLNQKANIEIYNTNWGFSGSTEEFCAKSKAEGYDGIELWCPRDEADRKEMLALTEKYQLKLGLLAGNSGATPAENISSFKSAIQNAISCKPAFINCHSGKDFFTYDQNKQFIEYTIGESNKSGIPIHHETHRGRILYNVPIAEKFISAYEALTLTLDISHWTVVHESLLANQAKAVQKALSRTGHIHSRIGFQEAPQIPNPDDDQYKAAIEAHFAWWDEVVRIKAEKQETLTMTTEFGPPPYMWTQPYSKEPLANVWDVNVQMMKMWRKRYD